MNDNNQTNTFHLQRYFSIAAFVGTLIAVLLLTLFYRQVFEGEIITIGEQDNLALAKSSLNIMEHELAQYLDSVKEVTGSEKQISPIPLSLEQEFKELMEGTHVIRINIYNQNGVVVFSTMPSYIGRDESTNERFGFALNGRVASKLFYHDSLNIFSRTTDQDNLIETYVPIRSTNSSSIVGVFEIYTDVSSMVDHVEQARLVILLGVALIMILFYLFQVYIVRRAAIIISNQQQSLRERSRTLEMLSAQLMNAEENERKRIASDLHEGIAQTLAAAKVYLEKANQIQLSNDSQVDLHTLKNSIHILQEAIQEVRTLAMDLRPTTLDEFGLIKTIDWLCKEFNSLYSNIRLEANINLEEEDVPAPLKTILFRVIKEGLASVGNKGLADNVSLRVSRYEHTLALLMEDNAVAYHPDSERKNSHQNVALSTIRERIVLTGGSFKIESNRQGGTVMTAEWPC
jgi:signal transduction histidine kinase